MLLQLAVTEVEPTDIQSGIKHRGQPLRVGRSGAECGDDLGVDAIGCVSHVTAVSLGEPAALPKARPVSSQIAARASGQPASGAGGE